ncbi:PREDICTED: uncharacterized protein LOC104806304 [Tarenaya hassleriana]|uniref:uncharacterized protein LOC104806304 n=1 Tax=Tarenaya hassleriana TaxID=28532 RepID=UPI00053C7C78|nr:PREDICTED: uncharacterized protein LOC104806304 [Tarenaya hassleriana]
MATVKNPYLYTKMEKEDPEDMIHRRAQFLIQKILERADNQTRQQQRRWGGTTSFARKRVAVGIRLRIGRRLRRLRKSVIVHVSSCNNVFRRHFRSWRNLFSASRRNISPVFVLRV